MLEWSDSKSLAIPSLRINPKILPNKSDYYIPFHTQYLAEIIRN